jgi:hypothetical protein
MIMHIFLVQQQAIAKPRGLHFIWILLLLFMHFFMRVSCSPTTYCVAQDGSTFPGPRLCNNTDEVQMLGSYVNIGINTYGGFGTSTSYSAPFFGRQLGIICNFDKSGFTEDPASYSGDYLADSLSTDGTLAHIFYVIYI